MPYRLRSQALRCFYCGERSSQQRISDIRQWTCQSCRATNYLDEDGNITDPPPPLTPKTEKSLRYAHVPPRSSSPTFQESEEIFCATCTKNQHIVAQALSEYLPSEDDPRYKQYAASLESYRQELEQRYPQICSQCAPRAREKIKRAGKLAMSDHIRRNLDRTKQQGFQTDTKRIWTNLILRLGGLGWWTGNFLQLAWHVSCVMDMVPSRPEGNNTTWYETCFNRAVQAQASVACQARLSPLVPLALASSLLCAWWNNKMRGKYLRSEGYMSRLKDYYLLQFIALAVKAAAWWYLADVRDMSVDAVVAAHCFSAFFILTSAAILSTLVKLDPKPKISFHMDDSDILPNVQAQQPASLTPKKRFPTSDHFSPSSFAIEDFNPPNPTLPQQQQQPRPQHFPLTPPPDEQGDPDAMDWAPTTPQANLKDQFMPRPARIPLSTVSRQQMASQPSPFYGTLPPAPIAPAHKHRKPAEQMPNIFNRRPAEDGQRESSFTSWGKRGSIGSGLGGLSLGGGPEDDLEEENGRREMQMAPQKLFAKSEGIDTGLEAMFDEVFSLGEQRPLHGVDGTVKVTSQASEQRHRDEKKDLFYVARKGEFQPGYAQRAEGSAWVPTLLAFGLPLLFLGVAVVVVKGYKQRLEEL